MREDDISRLIKHINFKVKTRGDSVMKKRDLTFSQMQVLFALERNGGSMSQKQLEDKLGVAHPTVVGLVKRLEKNDYVRSIIDENDKRKKIIEESENARRFKDEMKSQLHEISLKMFAKLNEEEKEELFRMLTIINDSLSEDSEVNKNV
ncbi:MAG: MarR family transcriptional regulator [Erysipelotrichaceae bacterium]|nr:MarR family transcriptional regulator [Erysipelotrichaceae bacterium]